MEFTSPTLRYCFNPFEFCIESDHHADTDKAAQAIAEQLAEDYRVAIVRLSNTQTRMRQHEDGAFLTVHLPVDHHRLRRPQRLLDADVVIVSGAPGNKLAKVLLSASIDNTIAGAITCLHDLSKAASLKRAARSVSHWLEQRASKVPIYALLVDQDGTGGNNVRHAAHMLESVCAKTFVFATGDPDPDYPGIGQHFPEHGLMGAVLSAQLEHPNVAWLVVNASHGGLHAECMQFILEHRNPFRYVTVFQDTRPGAQGEQCGIWEPKSHRRVLEGLGCGVSTLEELLTGTPHTQLKLPQV